MYSLLLSPDRTCDLREKYDREAFDRLCKSIRNAGGDNLDDLDNTWLRPEGQLSRQISTTLQLPVSILAIDWLDGELNRTILTN